MSDAGRLAFSNVGRAKKPMLAFATPPGHLHVGCLVEYRAHKGMQDVNEEHNGNALKQSSRLHQHQNWVDHGRGQVRPDLKSRT